MMEKLLAISCQLSAVVLMLLAAPASAEWYSYSPAGSVDGKGIMADVLSRCDEQGRRTAQADNDVTTCHEATHMLNSRIRNSTPPGDNAFYVGGGRCLILPEPKITLGAAAKYVRQHRNRTFQIYFVDQQQHWNDAPLYILDEWSAYLNGSQHAVESGDGQHGSHDRCNWFCHYADAVVEAVRRHDPQYSKLDELTAFVGWQKQRAAQITGPRPQQATELLTPAAVSLIDFAPRYRELNTDDSCGYIATANCLRFCGLWREAQAFRQRWRGPCSDGSISAALRSMGIKHQVGHGGDEKLLRWSIEQGRGAAVTWGGAHVVNLVGIEGDNAVLMGNLSSGIKEYRREAWREFIANHRAAGGWSIVVLAGDPGAPVASRTPPSAEPRKAKPE